MSSLARKHLWTWSITALAALAALVAGVVIAIVAPAANAPRAQGEEVPQSVLHAETRMGAVELKVRDLPSMAAFYGQAGVGLGILSETDDAVSLGVNDEELIRLVPADGEHASAQDSGLYHSAIVFPDRPALAQAMVRMATQYPEQFQGAADHRVSKAFYFGDPESNGVELYIDTPSSEWVWEGGQVQMGSDPLDPNAFIQEHLGDRPTGDAAMGHVHLKVGDVDQAREFYADTLGFAVTAEANGALFMSAGGYHHHLAANTWGSAGAGVRPAGLGLGEFAVVLPEASELDGVAERLQRADVAFEQDDTGLTVADPWGNQVRFTVAG
ncbi:VOC family protein [Parafrigoribacterium mesophilum]|uniref:VOC family protein n=1 Tax=Parafrigoribacterium mesophilum TaxID=433646 RepID=UPI0031FCF45B